MKWNTRHTTLVFVLIGALIQVFALDYYKAHNHIRGDGLAYYSYLPASFIYHDPANRFYAELDGYEQQKYWLQEGRNGAYLPKMTMGLALLWAPGYGLAHLLAPVFGYTQDGWSEPYRLSILLSGLLALLIGAHFTYRILEKRFSAFISAISVLLLVFATHVLHYGVSDVSMSHIYTFALVAAFIHLSEHWLEKWRTHHLILLGLLLGVIILIRPTNGIVALYPLICFIMRKENWHYLLHWSVLPAITAFLIPLVLQALFWKITTGNWIYYSYTDEAIYWLNPHLLEGLFSYRNGWLLYTPLFLLLIPGIFALRRIDNTARTALSVLLVLHTYITVSWWCWYYGDSLSMRPMMDLYPVFALAIAAGIWQIVQWKAWLKWPVSTVIVLLTYNNLLFIRHYNSGKLTGSSMSETAFWALFLKQDAPSHLALTLAYHQPDNDRLRLGLDEISKPDTQLITPINLDTQMMRSIKTPAEKEYGPSIAFHSDAFRTGQDEYIHLRFRLNIDEDHNKQPTLVFTFEENGVNKHYEAIDLADLNLKGNQWIDQSFYLKWQHEVDSGLVLKHYLWNKERGDQNIMLMYAEKIRIAYPPMIAVNQ